MTWPPPPESIPIRTTYSTGTGIIRIRKIVQNLEMVSPGNAAEAITNHTHFSTRSGLTAVRMELQEQLEPANLQFTLTNLYFNTYQF